MKTFKKYLNEHEYNGGQVGVATSNSTGLDDFSESTLKP